MRVAVGIAGLMASLSVCQACTVDVLNNIQRSPNPQAPFERQKNLEHDWLKKTGVEVRGCGGWGAKGRYRMCNRERESMGTSRENKSHDIIVWQEAGSGVARSRGGGERERRGHPQSPILPLGAHPLEWIRAEQCALNEWDPKSHRRKTNHQWERGRAREGWRKRQREMEMERERERL